VSGTFFPAQSKVRKRQGGVKVGQARRGIRGATVTLTLWLKAEGTQIAGLERKGVREKVPDTFFDAAKWAESLPR
jgi:hypothetical protein